MKQKEKGTIISSGDGMTMAYNRPSIVGDDTS